MRPIVDLAKDYLDKRFLETGSTAHEMRFRTLLALARIANLLRLGDATCATNPDDVLKCLGRAPDGLFEGNDKARDTHVKRLHKEWRAAVKLAMTNAAAYKEPATSLDKDHMVINSNYCYSWWMSREAVLPTWCKLVKVLAILQPSSATTERVFSLYKRMTEGSKKALMDIKRAKVIVPYNERMRTRPVVVWFEVKVTTRKRMRRVRGCGVIHTIEISGVSHTCHPKPKLSAEMDVWR